MALALPNLHKFIMLALMSAAVFVACFFISPSSVRAEELTEEQIDAVLNLLQSFNANKASVEGVEAALRGGGEIAAAKEDDGEDEDGDENGEDVDEDDKDEDDDEEKEEKKEEIKLSVREAPLCPRITKHLSRGMSDSNLEDGEVRELQKFLAAHYNISEEDLATGYFGPLTHWLLVNFQEKEGLLAEGFVGELTRGKILKYCLHQLDNRGKGNAEEKIKAQAPSCTLSANEDEVEAGDEVTLTWESKNAAYAKSPEGDKDPAEGSRTVAVVETTLFKKTVYGPGGEASCTVEVEVEAGNSEGDEGEDEGEDTPPVQVVMQAYSDAVSQLASATASGIAIPFWLLTDALTEFFVLIGV